LHQSSFTPQGDLKIGKIMEALGGQLGLRVLVVVQIA
jgi:hypothetical protein